VSNQILWNSTPVTDIKMVVVRRSMEKTYSVRKLSTRCS